MQREEEIVVYPNRKRTTWRVILLDALSLLVCLIFLGGSVAVALAAARASTGPGDIISILLLCMLPFLLVLAVVVLLVGIAWNMTSQFLLSQEPYLVIDHDGVTVGKQALLRSFFISWAEIGSISCGHDGQMMYKSLIIRPKNDEAFFERFSLLERWNLNTDSSKNRGIAVPQMYLEVPIETLLFQVRERYGRELRKHQVHIDWVSIELLRYAAQAANEKRTLQ